ncbi:MAG: cation:proton antiporter [Phycisphaerales bacterium]
MNSWGLLLDILILLSGAMVLGVIFSRLKQSPIVGYLAAGMLLGPHAIGIVGEGDGMHVLAELGVSLLLFTIGLEFSWPRLKGLGGSALIGGAGQILVTTLVFGAIALGFGYGLSGAYVIGAVVTLSSTACVLRTLASRSEMESRHGRLALGVLLMQDIAVVPAVLMVSLLAGVSGGHGSDGSHSGDAAGAGEMAQIAGGMVQAVLGALVLIVVLYGVLNVILPRMIGKGDVSENRDLPILLAMVIGLGSAWGAHAMGLSPALGAFAAGMLLAESPYATQVRADAASVKTLLVTLFFSSVGMLADPVWIMEHWWWVLLGLGGVLIGKPMVIWVVLRVLGVGHRGALSTGLCLAQIGEFSFVIATAGRTLIGDEVFGLVVSVSIASMFVTPTLVANAGTIGDRVVSMLVRLKILKADPLLGERASEELSGHAVIVGFGPAGQGVGKVLKRAGIAAVVLDLNPVNVGNADRFGFVGQVGDATQAEVLEHAGTSRARIVVVAVPDPSAAGAVVSAVRSLNTDALIVARARYHRHIGEVRRAGADVVVDEEEIVGAELSFMLQTLLEPEEIGKSAIETQF